MKTIKKSKITTTTSLNPIN